MRSRRFSATDQREAGRKSSFWGEDSSESAAGRERHSSREQWGIFYWGGWVAAGGRWSEGFNPCPKAVWKLLWLRRRPLSYRVRASRRGPKASWVLRDDKRER